MRPTSVIDEHRSNGIARSHLQPSDLFGNLIDNLLSNLCTALHLDDERKFAGDNAGYS